MICKGCCSAKCGRTLIAIKNLTLGAQLSHPQRNAVKVARFALDGQTPHSNLYLSLGHALYLRGLLIPVKDLVNGRSIVAGQHASAFTLDY